MHKTYLQRSLIIFFSLLTLNVSLFPIFEGITRSVKLIKANSIKQNISNSNKLILNGNVDIIVDNKLHLWADIVEINRKEKKLLAKKGINGAVVIENDSLLILADEFSLDLTNKKGSTKNIRIHLKQGYLSAQTGEKIDDNNWVLNNISFTACDHPIPHWSIIAKRAVLYKNYLVKISGLLFKTNNIPVFLLPYIALPLQKRSKSGFLIPRITYDNDLGLGIRQEFYWSIFSRCDSTLGIDWRDRKGVALFNEFRWARNNESFTNFNWIYALEKNAFVKKKNRIQLDTVRRYWVNGRDFRNIDNILGRDFKTLLRVDFGTDKKIGYQFFDKFFNVNDTFKNSTILRSYSTNNIINFGLYSQQTVRSKFLGLSSTEKIEIESDLSDEDKYKIDNSQKEIEDRFILFRLPRFDFNMVNKKLGENFYFRHNFFIDYIFSREKKSQRFYVNSKVVKEEDFLTFKKAHTFRFKYYPEFQANIKVKEQNLMFFLKPNIQIRTNLKDRTKRAERNVLEAHFFDHAALRFMLNGSTEWVMPELYLENSPEVNYVLQPILKWSFTPKFYQDHWYHSDLWDRVYPKNEIDFCLRNSWSIYNLLIDFNIRQGLDFYSKKDRFFMHRSPDEEHLYPLVLDLFIDTNIINVFLKQEYDWRRFQLLSTELNLSFKVKLFKLYISSIYQHEKIRLTRELFSDIPNSLILSLDLPITNKINLFYEGQFYSKKRSYIVSFGGLRPLQHALKLNYEGHCWGVSLGYEEKKYREYGHWKNDKAYSLFLRLDSLGSFARRFKKPVIINKP